METAEGKNEIIKKNTLWEELNITKPYPVIEVSGSPFEMGKQHGEKAKAHVDRMFEYCFGKTTKRRIGGVELDLISYAESLLPLSIKYSPELVEECRGIAVGSGHDFREIFAMQFFVEYGPPDNMIFSSCSTVMAAGTGHAEGHTLVGWNDDMDINLTLSVIILRAFPEKGKASASICFAGAIPECGATADRMVVCNALPGKAVSEGVPYLFIQRKALLADTMQQAIDAVTGAKRTCPMHYTIVDKSGPFVGIETIPGQYHILKTFEDCCCHTNHFLSPQMTGDENPGSVLRQKGLERYLQQYRGKINHDNMLEVLSDHELTLCRHNATVTCMICDLTIGEIAFSTGPPCLGRFQEIIFQ